MRTGDAILKCGICGNHEDNVIYNVLEMMFDTREQFRYFQCSRCKCLQISEIPRDTAKYYPRNYYSFSGDPGEKYKHPVERALRKLSDHYTVFDHGLLGMFIGRMFPNKKLKGLSRGKLTKNSRILDVGCGTGARLYALREIGFKNLLGIDPYLRKDILYENGLRILKQSVDDVSGEWDLIMYHHSFEHISDPLAELKKVGKLLHGRGVCLLRIPTVSSYAWEHYREHWVQIDAPRHYYLHSLESINVLAEAAGFYLQDVLYDSTVDQFRASELYRQGIPLFPSDPAARERSGSLISKQQIRLWKKKTGQLNKEKRGDQAAFYLIKR